MVNIEVVKMKINIFLIGEIDYTCSTRNESVMSLQTTVAGNE
jgi:hypothetical protein